MLAKVKVSIDSQKQVQSLKLKCKFDLLKEEKLRAPVNMCHNKELCIKLKKAKIDDQNLWLSPADLCIEFCKLFEKLLQNKDVEKFCFCYTNFMLKSNKYLPQFYEDIATIIINKVTDRLLLKSKSGNEDLPDFDKTDTTQEISEKEIHGLG